MKALSIWQPHASLLVLPNPATGLPFKPYETRGWAAPAWIIGRRVAIHAAKNQTDITYLRDFWRERDDEFVCAVRKLGFADPSELPLGAVVGTAVLKASHRTETLVDPGEFGDFADGRFAWEMADARPLATPIPFRGMQGFFDVPDDLLKEVAHG